MEWYHQQSAEFECCASYDRRMWNKDRSTRSSSSASDSGSGSGSDPGSNSNSSSGVTCIRYDWIDLSEEMLELGWSCDWGRDGDGIIWLGESGGRGGRDGEKVEIEKRERRGRGWELREEKKPSQSGSSSSAGILEIPVHLAPSLIRT